MIILLSILTAIFVSGCAKKEIANPNITVSLSYKVQGSPNNEIEHYGDVITYTYVINNTGNVNLSCLSTDNIYEPPSEIRFGNISVIDNVSLDNLDRDYFMNNDFLVSDDSFVKTGSTNSYHPFIIEPGESWTYSFNHTFDKRDITNPETLHSRILPVSVSSGFEYFNETANETDIINKSLVVNMKISDSMNLYLTKLVNQATLYDNMSATNTTYDNVINFIQSSNTTNIAKSKVQYDEQGNPYPTSLYIFAEELHNAAEAAGISCGIVYLESSETGMPEPEIDIYGHSTGMLTTPETDYISYGNYFDTTDRGRVYIDTSFGDIAVFENEPKVGEVWKARMSNGTGIQSEMPVQSIDYLD
ncbi:hypothetical protein [Methanosarcina sp. UBA5]|uniref:hypothetical protein n=1 Tax=Methanosarcina sp. UBA5 TaxID=1915593 RepID=UPI0025F7652B|nr:hypothetical protein [Methanosarcina sp. UBA5]